MIAVKICMVVKRHIEWLTSLNPYAAEDVEMMKAENVFISVSVGGRLMGTVYCLGKATRQSLMRSV